MKNGPLWHLGRRNLLNIGMSLGFFFNQLGEIRVFTEEKATFYFQTNRQREMKTSLMFPPF